VIPEFNKMYLQTNLVHDISIPHLSLLGIEHFFYMELDEEGRFALYDSNADLFHDYLDTGIILEIPQNILKTYQSVGVYSIDIDTLLGSIQAQNYGLFEKYNLKHSLRLVEVNHRNGQKILSIFAFDASDEHTSENELLKYYKELHAFSQFFTDRFIARVRTVRYLTEDKKFQQMLKEWFAHYMQEIEVRNKYAVGLNQANAGYMKSIKKSTLTKRELEILRLYKDHYTSEDTAKKLNISKRTVDRHFENMREKFSCFTKEELLKHSLELGLMKLTN
jgi:LuxR family transcriptional regulator